MKYFKMLLYGEPGVGKSVFAFHSPNPFFITTDGNYEWLTEFGAKEEAHVAVSSWEEAKKVFREIRTDKLAYNKYQTIVVDLLEDLYTWAEREFCQRHKVEHISDAGGYGKGYKIVFDEFTDEIGRLLSMDKNVILLMHGETAIIGKTRNGDDITKFRPSSLMREKILEKIVGRVRYFLRCYIKNEKDENGKTITTRWLSLIPKDDEYGVIRGVNTNEIPQDIPLDWNTFADVVRITDDKDEDVLTITSFEESSFNETPIEKISTPKTQKERVVETTIESKVVEEKVDLNLPEQDEIVEKTNQPMTETAINEAEKIQALDDDEIEKLLKQLDNM